ncbi:hypothetical protein OJ997_01935 [Solirubrobacter phytolaccae]|uniref:Uncharacterized protein n=1 Tax=Solirubrobacter phytolaccae TaxID=1404360 RepID=A0A9X3N3Q8_9ACTN|nr:hypothetical protein [Solirubrobacter phytolaccae]MDA0179039.1 hypothetical protein [Solirubrobacter phytolaccae]
MRTLAVLLGLIATVAGAYGGFLLMREVGPGDLSNSYGRGTTAIDGNLLESRNFARVVEALERDLGPDGRISNLNVELLEATATGVVDGRRVSIRIDANGNSEKNEFGDALPTGTIPVSKIDPAALDVLREAAVKETGEPVKNVTLYGGNRQWTVYMLRGEPDSFVANLNGTGLRLSGEENPDPLGGAPDSLLRAKNLQKVLDAAAKEGSRLLDLTLWPERASVQVEKGGRAVSLQFGFDAELTSRDVNALNGAQTTSIPLSRVDARAVERMAKSKYAKGLKGAMYAILRPQPIEGTPQWLLYLPEGSDPPYITANLKGRGVSWPGRG